MSSWQPGSSTSDAIGIIVIRHHVFEGRELILPELLLVSSDPIELIQLSRSPCIRQIPPLNTTTSVDAIVATSPTLVEQLVKKAKITKLRKNPRG